jgi:hypothetical protein
MSGTVMVILIDLVAWRVRVHREPVLERMVSRRRSGVLERKQDTREEVGSDWAAKRTVCRSSCLATADTVGSCEFRIFKAWTMVWTWFSRMGSMKASPPDCFDAKM